MKSKNLLINGSLLLCLFLIFACGSTGSDGNSSKLKGTWKQQDVENPSYLDITSNKFTILTNNYEGCLDKRNYDYERIDGSEYQLTYRGTGEQDTLNLSVNNNTLTTSEIGIYKRTDIDVDALDSCN